MSELPVEWPNFIARMAEFFLLPLSNDFTSDGVLATVCSDDADAVPTRASSTFSFTRASEIHIVKYLI